jgi:hypothetical protein
MTPKHHTVGPLVGLVFVVAGLAGGTASASIDGPAASFYTPQGLKADGLRLQGTAQVYERLQGLKADGLRLQGIAQVYKRLQTRPAASFYTPQALKAEGLRWQAIARAYQPERPPVAGVSQSNGFDWSDAGVGAAGGLGFAAFAAALIVTTRRIRRTKLAL